MAIILRVPAEYRPYRRLSRDRRLPRKRSPTRGEKRKGRFSFPPYRIPSFTFVERKFTNFSLDPQPLSRKTEREREGCRSVLEIDASLG